MATIKNGIYYCKPRVQNFHTFLELEKVEGEQKYNGTYHFKSGATHKEEFTSRELNEMLRDKLIFKTKEKTWDIKLDVSSKSSKGKKQ